MAPLGSHDEFGPSITQCRLNLSASKTDKVSVSYQRPISENLPWQHFGPGFFNGFPCSFFQVPRSIVVHPTNRQALDADNAKDADDTNAPKCVFKLYCSRSVLFKLAN